MNSQLISEGVALAPLTTFRIGGMARYFATVTEAAQLSELSHFAREHDLRVFILGGGSNILFSDEGFDGLVLKMDINGIAMCDADDDDNAVIITSGAGVKWDTFVARVVELGFSGAENLSLIPGTVGGAVVQNIGAYGSEVSDIVESVEVFDPKSGVSRTMKKTECTFGYRDSYFKHDGTALVIVRVHFRLQKTAVVNIAYKDLAALFAEDTARTPTIRAVREAVIAIRTRKFPPLDSIGTAGSFYKNPVVTRAIADTLIARFPYVVHFDLHNGYVKFSAAWIIDNILHLRGGRIGNVGCWNEQALVIVNYGGASSDEVKNFTAHIIDRVKKETMITLEREVIFV